METRSGVVWRHVHLFIRTSSCGWPTFAARIREVYEARVPFEFRLVVWSDNKQAYERMRLDAQILRRFESDVKFGLPDDLEEAIVIALRELGYAGHDDLMQDLAGRYGLMAAPLPIPANTGMGGVGALTSDFGLALQALEPLIEDDVIDERDAPHAKKALNCLLRVIARSTTIAARITDILPDEQRDKFLNCA